MFVLKGVASVDEEHYHFHNTDDIINYIECVKELLFSLTACTIWSLKLKMHLHATYDSGLEGIYLIICSPIFCRSAMCQIFPHLFPGECECWGNTRPPPPRVLQVCWWHWSCQGIAHHKCWEFLLSVFGWAIVFCKYIKLNLLYTCIVIATFPSLLY